MLAFDQGDLAVTAAEHDAERQGAEESEPSSCGGRESAIGRGPGRRTAAAAAQPDSAHREHTRALRGARAPDYFVPGPADSLLALLGCARLA